MKTARWIGLFSTACIAALAAIGGTATSPGRSPAIRVSAAPVRPPDIETSEPLPVESGESDAFLEGMTARLDHGAHADDGRVRRILLGEGASDRRVWAAELLASMKDPDGGNLMALRAGTVVADLGVARTALAALGEYATSNRAPSRSRPPRNFERRPSVG